MNTILYILGWLFVGFMSYILTTLGDIVLHKLKSKYYDFSVTRFIQEGILAMLFAPVVVLVLLVLIWMIQCEIVKLIVNNDMFNPIKYTINNIDKFIIEFINGKER